MNHHFGDDTGLFPAQATGTVHIPVRIGDAVYENSNRAVWADVDTRSIMGREIRFP